METTCSRFNKYRGRHAKYKFTKFRYFTDDLPWRKQASRSGKHMHAVKANCRLFARPHDPVDLTALFIIHSEINLATDMVALDRICLHLQNEKHVIYSTNGLVAIVERFIY